MEVIYLVSTPTLEQCYNYEGCQVNPAIKPQVEKPTRFGEDNEILSPEFGNPTRHFKINVESILKVMNKENG